MGRSSKFGDFLTGVLVGAAVGYVIALLNAPRPGDETRQMLNDKSRELRDRAMDTVQNTRDMTGKLVSEGRQRLNMAYEDSRSRVKERVSDLKDRGESTVTGVRAQVSDELRQFADQVDPNHPGSSGMDTGPEI